jgi:hypothetical protein
VNKVFGNECFGKLFQSRFVNAAALRYRVSGRSRAISIESSAVGWLAVAVASVGKAAIEGQLRLDCQTSKAD